MDTSEEYIQKVVNHFELFLLENNFFSEFCNYIFDYFGLTLYEFCSLALKGDYILKRDPKNLIYYYSYHSDLFRRGLHNKWFEYIKEHDL